MRPFAPRDRLPFCRHGRRHRPEHGAQLRLDLTAEAPLRFMHEPPGYQLHLWREDSGLVTHTAVFGEWSAPHPFPAAS
jgi:hypothetical protein